MKFYKLNDTWVSWDELHNGYGYTTGPSVAVTYKSAHNGSSWGEDAGSGYYVGDIDDMVHGSFWCDSDYGWFELDGLVWNPEIYPSNATPLMMQNGGITSPAVSLESDGVTYYLIKVIVADTGWITADEASELGWEVYDEMQGTFIVFDTVENKIVSAFTNELTYGEIEGIVLQSPRLVYGVDISVPTAQFWFTANGRDETENRALNTGNPLYTEDGVRLLPSTHSNYIGAIPLSFMEVDGDMFMADSDPENNYVRLVNDSLNLYIKPGIPIRDESAWAVQFERIFTLSFANTQLPGITITMPADETGYKGTSITLPTMSGEYESGGKTWTPSAWDIGAFGSSYTLNADTVAHLIFEEVLDPEIDIDVIFGDPVTIPAGYSIQSVKANVAYAFPTNADYTPGYTGFYFDVLNKDEYFTDADVSLLGYQIAPCLQLWMPTEFSDNSWRGYYLSCRTSQTPTRVAPTNSNCVMNGTYSGESVTLHYEGISNAANVNSAIISAINIGGKALQMRRYDENDVRIKYYFNVPTSLWSFSNGVFAWASDVNNFSYLVHWYYFYSPIGVRIHCIKV